MSPTRILFTDLDDETKKEVFENPNIQSLCLQFVGRVKRLENSDDPDTRELEAEHAAVIAEELMSYLPFNALDLTNEDGSTRITTSPSEIAFTLAYYLSKARIIP